MGAKIRLLCLVRPWKRKEGRVPARSFRAKAEDYVMMRGMVAAVRRALLVAAAGQIAGLEEETAAFLRNGRAEGETEKAEGEL